MRLDAQMLAGALLAVCEVGLDERERGRCIGNATSQWIEVGVREIMIHTPGKRGVSKHEVRRAVEHAKFGHDGGCIAFGVPVAEVEGLLRRHDQGSAYALLREAYRDAVDEVTGSRADWSRDMAKGAIASQVCARLTPARVPIAKGGFDAPESVEPALRRTD